MDEQIGVKYTYIAAGDKKTEGNPHEPLSKAARADIQAEVDREYGIFVATVARNRGFAGATQKKIQATEAGVLFADDALPLLADEVGTLEECLGALTQKVNGSKLSGSGKVAISAEAGNNAAEPQPSPNPPAESGEPPKEGVEAMATLETGAAAAEEIARLKAQLAEQGARLNALAGGAAAADKKDPPNDEPDPDDEDDDKKDAKGKKGRLTQMPLAASANDAAVTISTLCQIANAPELAAEYMVQGFSVDKVIAALNARRSKASAENTVNSYVAGNFGGAAPAAGAAPVDRQPHRAGARHGRQLRRARQDSEAEAVALHGAAPPPEPRHLQQLHGGERPGGGKDQVQRRRQGAQRVRAQPPAAIFGKPGPGH